jgi:hypothetical protein
MSRRNLTLLIIVGMVTLGVLARLLPHAANFAPVTALSLLAATCLPRRWALLVPLGIMAVSDVVIGLHPLVCLTWGCFALIALLGSIAYKRTQKHWVVALLAPVGSTVFFVVTNFGVWLQGQMYARDLAGLWRCYEMALPFFRATLISDIIFTIVLFGMLAIVSKLSFRRTNYHQTAGIL